MSISSILKKEGINIIGELNTLDVNKIASLISEKICAAFPEYNLNQSDLFVAIARLNMYIAEMPNDTIGAKLQLIINGASLSHHFFANFYNF